MTKVIVIAAIAVIGVYVLVGLWVIGNLLRNRDTYPSEAADPVDEHFKTSARDEELDQLNALWARPAYIKEPKS